MNEFVAPGIFVEEVSGPRPIEGVPTSTTGFVGATSVGPTEEPVLVQSITELEATFGEPCRLVQAGRAFFANGGPSSIRGTGRRGRLRACVRGARACP